MTLNETLILLMLGLGAGVLGGLVGIGGSIVMIPVLTIALQHDHHLSQAVAMIVNVFVALPALLQHHRARAVRWKLMLRMLPAGIVFILIGVESSNQVSGPMLEKIFGVFLLYVVATNVLALGQKRTEPESHEQRGGWGIAVAIGSTTGFFAGLLGVGGGIIAVPLLQKLARLPLRQCIATTAALMCITAAIGAWRKNLALPDLGFSPRESILIAGVLAPTAVAGALIGGRLTHTLPLFWVRVAFILLMAWASVNMLGIV